MTTYAINWQETIDCWTEVEAESEEDALAKLLSGNIPDADSDPGEKIRGSIEIVEVDNED